MKTLVTFLFIVTTIQVFCQETFIDFLDKQELKKGIEYKVIETYFQIDTLWKRDRGTRYYFDLKIIDKYKDVNVVILREENGIGSIAYLYSFTKKGKIIDKHKIMERFDNDDLLGPDYDFFYTFNDDLVTIEHRLFIPVQPTNDNPGKKHITENYRTFIKIINHGFFFELTEKKPPSNKRMFEYVSTNIVPTVLLKRLTKDDLAIMRNEIFASHGYIFKSERMSSYFKNKDWYKPRFKNVDDKLTPPEKDNLKLIRQYENY